MSKLPGFRASYAQVERALVQMHDVDPNDVPAFRSRVRCPTTWRVARGRKSAGQGPQAGVRLRIRFIGRCWH